MNNFNETMIVRDLHTIAEALTRLVEIQNKELALTREIWLKTVKSEDKELKEEEDS